MSTLIPQLLTRPKTFTSRLVVVLDAEAKRWNPDPERSEPTVDEAMRAWIDAERPDIRFVSSPSVSVYQRGDNEQTMFVSVSVLYVPAVEGATHERAAAAPVRKQVGRVVATVKPGRKDTTGVLVPPRKQT